MLMTLNDLFFSVGETTILEQIKGIISEQDRIGIIGENGAGKTTLLRLITGEYLPEKGEISIARGAVVGYLAQNSGLGTGRTVYEEAKSAYDDVLNAMAELEQLEKQMGAAPDEAALLERHDHLLSFIHAKDGYHMDTQIKKVLNGMSFPADTYEKQVDILSGGERTRLALAKLLLSAPDLLILDEPTNHLDFDTLEWLESFLRAYKGAIVVVSHDRYFLDQITNRIWEIEDQRMTAYKGNYSAYLPQKEAAVALQQKQHDADVEKAAKLQDYVDRNLVRASTSNMAKSRRKALEKMEITEKPRAPHQRMKLRFEFDVAPYEELLQVKDLTVKVEERTLVQGLDFQVLRGERLVIAGPNGAGKSTLLRVLTGKLRPAAGRVRLGQGARFSVFEQQQPRRAQQVIQVIWNKYPRMTELEVRSHLAKFDFRGEEVYKPTDALSGGELAKLRLAEIVLERPNLLFLDEPTNHLDIYTRESLGEALLSYEGTVVAVTHDRYLMQSLHCPILYLEEKGWTLYENYQKLLERSALPPAAKSTPDKGDSFPKNQRELRRRKAEQRQRLKELEEEIETLQGDIQGMENLLGTQEVATDHLRLAEIAEEMSDKRFRLNEAYEEWAQLGEEMEE